MVSVSHFKKFFQDPFGKFETINNLSDRLSLQFFQPVHPLLLNSTQLNPALSLFPAFLSSSFYYLDSIERVCRLKETLSPLTLLRLLIKEGSRCQRCSANWVVEKPHITEYEVSPVKPSLPSASLKCAASYQHLTHCWLLILWTEEILSLQN